MISAKRFTVIGEETNVAVADYITPLSDAIYSSPNLEVKDMSEDMGDFLKKGKAESTDLLSKVKKNIDPLARVSKDAFTSLKNIKALGTKDLDNAIGKLFPNSPLGVAAQAAYKQLAPSCRTGPMGKYNAGKPFDPSLDCNGKKSKGRSGGCSTAAFGSVLDKLSGGTYKSTYQDLNGSLSSLVALASQGYNMSMCGVFGALSGGLPTNVVSRGASMLLGSLGSTSNLKGIFDLAKTTAGLKLPIINEIPNGISNVFNNFKKPTDVKQAGFGQLSDAIDGSMESFESKWKKSPLDGAPSIAFIDSKNDDYAEVMKSKAMNFSVSEDALDAIPSDPINISRCGLLAKDTSFDLSAGMLG